MIPNRQHRQWHEILTGPKMGGANVLHPCQSENSLVPTWRTKQSDSGRSQMGQSIRVGDDARTNALHVDAGMGFAVTKSAQAMLHSFDRSSCTSRKASAIIRGSVVLF